MKSMMATILAGGGLVAMAVAVHAQELGSVKRGQALAETICAECHAVEKGQPRSRNGHAPRFETLATTPGMTPMALLVALRISHNEMPNLVLKNQEVDDIIAYIQTFK